MKRFLLFFLFIVLLSKFQAQITFCPPGATWNYFFSGPHPYWQIHTNRSITYVRDSLLEGNTVKALRHHHFFKRGSPMGETGFTLIKQSGDTVFMRNKWTNHQWQVLYNFAAQPGQSWTNTFNGTLHYTTTVNSNGTTVIGSETLKELKVTYSMSGVSITSSSGIIVERFGNLAYLFDYFAGFVVHNEMLGEFLCYSDSSTTLLHFSNKSCDYSNAVGFSEQLENSNLKIYPIPFSEVLYIETYEDLQITLTDFSGKILKQEELQDQRVNTSDLVPGMYFLQIKKQNESVYMTKIVKE